MKHIIHKVKSYSIVRNYVIDIVFDNNVHRKIDFSPVLHGELYGPLRNMETFKKVKLDADTLVWPNGADFDPATLYNWEKYVKELCLRLST